ncbi:sodium/bile acid cotransporter 7 [Wenyingzhuangia heitensis]|uniref:Sodium/bile acid cotransporter 7 n=1 Tax=Wenyingzhuangia heitensis TaxID=1487859 RepID=A0ABX0UCC4_9FLAO|nr:bile acid:sodium symporter family protein [Wenyingzhuangia heitensis]NIJ46482.1 sodium/bile acid cotransporter 7 [Wenyingzhuangia heitensis]
MFQKKLKIPIDGFILSLLGAILIAVVFPNGAKLLKIKEITNIGIACIFFFYGLKLSFKEIQSGLRNYKVHVLIQITTFLIFPIILILLKPIITNLVGPDFWIGLFFLAALPSTVSSSVVMVSLAKGNVPSAIFNASISGIIGVFVTPVWISIFVSTSGNISLSSVFLKLFIQIIAPLTLGLLFNKKIGVYAKKNSKRIAFFDKVIIVLIVYASFCSSILENIFGGVSILNLVYLFFIVVFLFGLLMAIVFVTSKFLKLKYQDKITAMFCGSKKSLVHGSAMLKIIFLNNPSAGMYLLPVMLYHISQLMILAFVANKLGNRN